jgi:hypothetical protein
MADQAFPTINGVEPSWADVTFEFPIYSGPTVQTDDVAGFKFSDKVTVGFKKGTSGGRIMARTVGDLESDASIVFYLGGWRKLVRILAPLAPQKRISLVGFDVLTKFSPPGEIDIFKFKIIGARVIGRSFDLAEGSDAQKVEIPVSVMRIEEDDGISLL